jgi:F-type H+-transporting ATPase subunit b
MLEINPGLIVWTIISFLVFAYVLGKYAWKPIVKALTEREDKIRTAIEQAERARAEAAELLKKNEENMARADEEYQRVIRESRSLAEKVREEMLAKARSQAQQELERATEEIRRNVEAARQQLRTEVADLAVKAAEKILDESIDEQRQKKLVNTFLDQLPKN